MSVGKPIRLGNTSRPLPLDFPRLSRGRSGSVEPADDSSSLAFGLAFACRTGRSGSLAGAAPALAVGSFLCRVGLSGSGAESVVLSPEPLLAVLLSASPLAVFLWSVGRSGSAGAEGGLESDPLPLLLLCAPSGCFRWSTGLSSSALPPSSSTGAAGLGLADGSGFHAP